MANYDKVREALIKKIKDHHWCPFDLTMKKDNKTITVTPYCYLTQNDTMCRPKEVKWKGGWFIKLKATHIDSKPKIDNWQTGFDINGIVNEPISLDLDDMVTLITYYNDFTSYDLAKYHEMYKDTHEMIRDHGHYNEESHVEPSIKPGDVVKYETSFVFELVCYEDVSYDVIGRNSGYGIVLKKSNRTVTWIDLDTLEIQSHTIRSNYHDDYAIQMAKVK